MKKIIFILLLILIAGNLSAQGLTKYGELTNTSTNFVNENGKIVTTPALNKSGEVRTCLAIGDYYGGGKVAYILQVGDPGYEEGVIKGLIVATSDQSTGIIWSLPPNQATTVGTTGSAIGTGSANTDLIIAQNSAVNTYAAGLARTYSGGGYSDWYLPSIDELAKLYINRVAIGDFNTTEGSDDYWSSSEASVSTANYLGFINQSTSTADKSNLGRVRAVRSFSIPYVIIGTQTWMARNLDVSTYRDGTAIPQVTDPTAWAALTTGAWCYYNNDPNSGITYGKLYNWYAVNDPRGLAPTGWHVAGDDDWTTLATNLGGVAVAGDMLKEAGTSNWQPTNTGATNSTGFTALPGGYRWGNGSFYGIGSYGYWWSITAGGAAYDRELHYGSSILKQFLLTKNYGFSVRCVKNP